MAMIETVFLDRDGVVNRKRPDYVKSWDEFEFLPGAKTAIRLLSRAGVRILIVTNQRAVALGHLSVATLSDIHRKMREELWAGGASFDGIYYCPHDVGQCTCRKPQSGMFLQAKRDFPEIEFTRSAMVGDSLIDLEAGWRLGCRTFLIADEVCQGGILNAAANQGLEVAGVAQSLYDATVRFLLPSFDPTIRPLVIHHPVTRSGSW